MSRLRESVKDIPEEKRKLYRSLTKISMNVSKALRESEMSKEEVAEAIDRPPEYMDRFFGGGINLSLRTIFKLEEALDVELIETKEFQGDTDPKRRRDT